MNLTFKDNLNETTFNEFTYNHTVGTFFQSSNWAKVKLEWTPIYTGVYDNDKLIATSMVLKRKIVLNYSLLYVPRGPIMDFDNKVVLAFYLDNLKQLAKANQAISITIDPYIINDQFDMNEVMKDLSKHQKLDNQIIKQFTNKQFMHKGFVSDLRDSYQPRFTPVIELKGQVDYTASRAYKNGAKALNSSVVIERNPSDAVERLASLVSLTEEHKDISLRGAEYFKRISDAYAEDCLITIANLNVEAEIAALSERIERLNETIENSKIKESRKREYLSQIDRAIKEIDFLNDKAAGQKDVDIAALLVLKNGSKSELLYSGMNRDFFKYFGSNVNYYDAINWSKDNELDLISFGGCSGTFDHGIDRFKATFNPQVVEYVGEFTYTNKKFIDKLFTLALKIRRR